MSVKQKESGREGKQKSKKTVENMCKVSIKLTISLRSPYFFGKVNRVDVSRELVKEKKAFVSLYCETAVSCYAAVLSYLSLDIPVHPVNSKGVYTFRCLNYIYISIKILRSLKRQILNI